MNLILILGAFAALGMFFNSGPTPPPLEPPPPPRQPQPDLAELARKRRDLQKRRRGVGSLRIDPATAVSRPGTGTGVSIPNNDGA